MSLPAIPEPVQIELEFTNRCNAACSGCPRDDMPVSGRMTMETLDRILDGYEDRRREHSLNRLQGSIAWPTVTVAGGGDPLLHPEAVGLLERCVERGFPTSLITNGSGLTGERIERLVAAGLSSICVSFWGIHESEYEAAMKLPYQRTLEKVERMGAAARDAGLPFCVIWVRSPEITSRDDEVAAFWGARGIDVDLTDNYMWNRGGLLAGSPDPAVQPPDPLRRIWCSDLFFSDAYRWNGEAVLCCCQYFTARPHTLGHGGRGEAERIAQRKADILDARPLPRMCQECKLPRTERARWLAGPWLEHAAPAERAMVLYEHEATGATAARVA
jgi:hypothetical protein